MGSQVSLTAKFALTALVASAALVGGQVRAEPVTDRALSHYQVFDKNGCQLLKVNFNFRVRYESHFPLERGDQLQVVVKAIDGSVAGTEAGTPREALRLEGRVGGLQAIFYEPWSPQGPVLSLNFTRPVAFNVAPGWDFQSIIIALADARGRACPAEDPERPGWRTTVRDRKGETVVSRRRVKGGETVVARRRPAIPAWETTLSEEDVPTAEETGDKPVAGVAEARTAMRARHYGKAIGILKSLDGPEAKELLGVAYQKNRQKALAKAAYEDYLRKYPGAPGVAGVQQRLAGLTTAGGEVSKLKRGRKGRVRDRSYWSVSGSVSEFYIRDDSYRTMRDPTRPLDFNETEDDHRVHRDTLMSSVNLFAAWGNQHYKSKFRFSGGEEHNFSGSRGDIISVSALYYDTTIKDWGMTARLGRQSRSGGGVLGRFDGAFVSWQANPWFRVSAVGGSPLNSRKDEPFINERWFGGASVNFGPVLGGFEASVFAIQQMDRDIIDRQAVGTELRYVDANKSAFITVDYDTHFSELNAAIFSGSWTFADKSTLRAGVDYRRAPYLSTWNALQGQTDGAGRPYKTLYDLLKDRTQDEAREMASDRTATYKAASVGYTRQLAEKLQVNLDVTASHIDGTIASYGVDAMPSTGTEFYYAAQLVGNNLLTKDDLWTAGFRYSDLHNSNNYAVDLSTRYLHSKALRISPRVLATYREGKTTDVDEYSVLPSLLMDYYWTKELNLELEVGSRFSWRQEGTIETQEKEVFITAGVRYDFYANGDKLE